ATAAAIGPVVFIAGNLATSVRSLSDAFKSAKQVAGTTNFSAVAAGFKSVAGAATLATVAVGGFSLAAMENSRQLGEALGARTLTADDILPAFDPENTRAQTLAIEQLALVIGGELEA